MVWSITNCYYLKSVEQWLKAMTELTNEELLAEDPESQSVEADDSIQYTPDPDEDSGVVAVEPLIITTGRAKRKQYLKDETLWSL